MAVVLTIGTGAVDAASFIRLGGVFSSVMTGNLVVSGYAIGTADLAHLLTTVTAVIGYVLGVAAGTGVAGRGGMIAVLGAELLALVAFAVGWEVTGGRPSAVALHVLLVLTAMAMGLQSAAMRALGGRRVVSTTYLTGTLTGVIAALLTSGGLAGGPWCATSPS
ncbi:YoaK family protein [Nonomuraea ferruginea]